MVATSHAPSHLSSYPAGHRAEHGACAGGAGRPVWTPIGERTSGALLRHVLPNIMAPIIVIFSVTIGGIIVAAASLSFLGFGLPPGVPSWGGMLSREGRQNMEMAPRLAIWPGLCLTIVVYSINMFGDALRDLLDPRLRGSVGRL